MISSLRAGLPAGAVSGQLQLSVLNGLVSAPAGVAPTSPKPVTIARKASIRVVAPLVRRARRAVPDMTDSA
ncbi:hypothetical protein A5675_08925 [Mycobacterium malmoense]|uniref:Uncharacterized protein n=1 Tax=Mycobacterium malmoense TaxID=1780 RepID=A0A1B9CIY7_MYCMA|nr:hypothetical protein A5675_08925 [Mycobacterium malmoense]OCB42175.1 hypothetical protein A5677_08710 [Mycobacterium malmoense]